MEIILSILIITHNQRELLKRCLESVLGQKLLVPFEVIVSDDRSTDGTKEFVEEEKLKNEGHLRNLLEIKYVYCNSNECNPKTVSERCGWNKLNAYKQARGKYFVNVDADDYLRSPNIYQEQINMLETHPECSMCMQQVLSLKEGDPFEKGNSWPRHALLKNGAIIGKEDFVLKNLRGLNQGYMIRRHPQDDMEALYGKWYDDTIITYHHVQYGPVVFINKADYVWMQNPQSISHNMTKDDMAITYGLLPLHHARMIPSMRYLFLQQGLAVLIHMLKISPSHPHLSQQYHDYLSQHEGFIYQYYTENKHGVYSTLRYNSARLLLLLMSRYQLTTHTWFDLSVRMLL